MRPTPLLHCALSKRIDPTGFADSWQDGLRTWANSYYAAIHWHPNAAPIMAGGGRERSDYLAMAEQLHDGLRRFGWPARHATMVASAANFLVLGAATTASGATADSGPARSSKAKRAEASPLDQFADTVDRASFTLALDAMISGLEQVYKTVKVDRRRRAAG